MKIVINNHRKIFAIQEEFSTVFPGRKIVFHAKSNTSGGASSEKLVTHSSKTLQECRVNHHEGTIEILPTMNFKEVKDILNNEFGLSAEILEKEETALI